MDFESLVAERGRVAREFRSTLTYLAMLRANLTRNLNEEGRQHLLSVIDEEAAECRRLSEELLQLDAAILKLQATLDVSSRPSPLLSAPVDF